MSDLILILVPVVAIVILFVFLDWTSWNPPKWVVRVRMWINRESDSVKLKKVIPIVLTVLILATVICAILAFTVPALQPMAGHIA